MLTTDISPNPRNRGARRRAAPSPDAFAYTISDAQTFGAPGRTSIYKMFEEGKLKKVKVAGRTMIEGDSLRALLRGVGSSMSRR